VAKIGYESLGSLKPHDLLVHIRLLMRDVLFFHKTPLDAFEDPKALYPQKSQTP
jgi:hypothetical protein